MKLRRYLAYIEYQCPFGFIDDGWQVITSYSILKEGSNLNKKCGDPKPFDACYEPTTFCQEKGIIKKIEKYNYKRAYELGLIHKIK